MSELGYKTIHVTGEDAFEFLQNQLTNDLTLLESEAEILSAWCNPKGRVIWFGTVSRTDSGYALTAADDLAEEMVKRLTIFRFRSKVEFSIEQGGTRDAATLIRDGHPAIEAAQSEKFTPHMLNLDLLEAVSITKGCYPGQEVVSRTHYRGATKRRMLRFESSAPVAPGDKVADGDRDIGEVLNAVGDQVLAVVPIDKANQQLTVGDATLVNSPLSYFEQ